MLLTAFSSTYTMLIMSRMLSGAGLGCVLPVGYSIISDAIPPEERSGWFGTLAILSSVSNGIGQALSSFLGPIYSWRFPFFLLAGISGFIIIFLFFVKIPTRGASEEELLDLAELNLEPDIYAATTNFNKNYLNVSEIFFDGKLCSASDYIKETKALFGSPFFEALRVYLSENEKSGGFIQSIIDCSILDAKEIHAELIQ